MIYVRFPRPPTVQELLRIYAVLLGALGAMLVPWAILLWWLK